MVSKLFTKSQTSCKGKKSDYKKSTFWSSTGVCVRPLVSSHIYINDITKNIESVIKLFADDTSVSLALKDPDRRATILDSDLEKLTAGRNDGKLVLMKKNMNC